MNSIANNKDHLDPKVFQSLKMIKESIKKRNYNSWKHLDLLKISNMCNEH